MNLQHARHRTAAETVKTAAKAFAAAALLTATIFGCDARPAPNNLEVSCSPCTKCAVPAEATIMEKGSPVRAPGFVSVAITENKDGSVSAIVSGSVAQHAFSSERIEFEVGQGELCTVRLSGKEQLDVMRPSVFFSDTKLAYPSSKRVPRPL